MATLPPSSRAPALKLRHRFHVRLSLMYGVLVVVILLAVSGFFYVRGVEAERGALQARLRIAAASLASSIRAEDLTVLQTAEDVARPEYQAIAARFRDVAAAEPEFSDLYIMRPSRTGEAPLEIVVDVVLMADAPPGLPGEAYEPPAGTKMIQGLVRPTFEDEPYTDPWGRVLSGYAPIRDHTGAVVAFVGIDVRATRLDKIKRDVALVAFTTFAIALIVLLLIAWVVARSISAPLTRIMDASNAIAAGDLEVRAQLSRQDEFGVVGRSFDQMAHGLQEREFIKATFGQYVSPEVVRRVIANRLHAVDGQRRHAAVLFADVRGFTTLSQAMDPEDVVSLLNDYLERMTGVLVHHGGRVDKFIGDAIMADWGALEDQAKPEVEAARAALDMTRALAKLNAERVAAGAKPLSIGVAVHAGQVVAGSIGSSRKLEYTVIGDAVNVASRLEGLCKGYGAVVVASGTLVDAAGLRGQARWLGTVVLRGRSEPTEIYELLDDDDPRLTRLAAYEAAMVHVRAGETDAARAALTALRAEGPDPVIDAHLARLSEN